MECDYLHMYNFKSMVSFKVNNAWKIGFLLYSKMKKNIVGFILDSRFLVRKF